MPSTGQGTRRRGNNNNNATMIIGIMKGPFTGQLSGAGCCPEHIIPELSSQAPHSQRVCSLVEDREAGSAPLGNPWRILLLKTSSEDCKLENFYKFLKFGFWSILET